MWGGLQGGMLMGVPLGWALMEGDYLSERTPLGEDSVTWDSIGVGPAWGRLGWEEDRSVETLTGEDFMGERTAHPATPTGSRFQVF